MKRAGFALNSAERSITLNRKRPDLALRPQDPQSPTDKNAKRDAAQQDVLMREVDEALRQDELSGFFKSWGIPLIAIVVIGLAGLGGYLWWDHTRQQAAAERGEKMIVAIDELEVGNLKDADSHLAEIAAQGGTASAVAATLIRAGIALEEGRTDDALKLYEQVSADKAAPQPYRDLAAIRAVAASFDTTEPQAVIDRLKALATPGNPWFGVAGELVGMAYLKQGKEELAGPLFASMARDEDLPESLRARSRQLAGLLGVDAIDDVIEAKAKPGESGDAASAGE